MPNPKRMTTKERAIMGAFEFLEAAASWADREGVDVIFLRDEGAWCALLRMSDSRGPFQATVEVISPAPDEGPLVYRKRVAGALSAARMTAKEARQGRIGVAPALVEYARAA